MVKGNIVIVVTLPFWASRNNCRLFQFCGILEAKKKILMKMIWSCTPPPLEGHFWQFNKLRSNLFPAALRSPVYRYVVTYTPSGPVSTSSGLVPFPSRFSFHCLDAVAFFGGLELILGKTPSDQDRRFQNLITRNLVSFAKTGTEFNLMTLINFNKISRNLHV